MDQEGDNDLETNEHTPRRCGLCREPGHDRRTCPLSSKELSSLYSGLVEERKNTATAIYDYRGTSRGMEGFLVRMALDIGHSAKNLKQKVIVGGKEMPQLRGFGERTQRDFRTLVKNHHDSPETLKAKILNMVQHYSRYVVIDNKQTIQYFTEILQYYAQRAKHFKSGRICNTIESVNRMIVTFSSKNIDEKKNYPMGANLAALQKNEGLSPPVEIFEDLGL